MEGAPVSLTEQEPAPHQSCCRDSLCCHGICPIAPLPSPLHCAGPVSMVTGLSDRWSSHRHGVLNSPTASPPHPSPPSSSSPSPQRVAVSPLALTLPRSLSVHALRPIACCRFIQKQITSLKGATTWSHPDQRERV